MIKALSSTGTMHRAEKDSILGLTFVKLSSKIKMQGLVEQATVDPASDVSGQTELRNMILDRSVLS